MTGLAEQLGIHASTVRFHLDALVAQGLVDRHLEQPTGRPYHQPPPTPQQEHVTHG
ncbi:helix-turn-helix domain-containing protein [Kribbella sp. NPDC048928]|uniref:helix-turn-helix domain-containing protein n=1 Tax=Kribbella sp. NPDC048928 TaxID=3364111 RepID=UPI00371EDA83